MGKRDVTTQRAVSWVQRRGWRLVVLVMALVVGYAYWQRHEQQPVVRSKTARVERGDIEQVVRASGHVVMKNYVDVGAKVSGQIDNVSVSVGELVKEGKLLAIIAPAVQVGRVESNRAQLARLKAELAGKNAELDFAQLQFQRQTQLKAENATREESFESSRMAMYSAAAKVDVIHAEIQQLEAVMKEEAAIQKQARVLAPISGTVVALPARVGQMVSTNRDVLMRIADLSKMSVQARVAEEDVTRLRKGMMAYFTTPGYPGKQWFGKLRQIMLLPADDSGKQGKKAYYTVSFDVANPDRELLSGMTAEVSFVLAKVERAVLIPAGLVAKPDAHGEQTLKVMQANGELKIRKVKIGIYNAEKAQVVSGLTVGERVLLP